MKHLQLSQKELMKISRGGTAMDYYDDNNRPIVVTDSEKESTGSNLIWAITAIIIVALVAGVAYFGLQQLNRNTKHDVDIKIDAPAVNR